MELWCLIAEYLVVGSFVIGFGDLVIWGVGFLEFTRVERASFLAAKEARRVGSRDGVRLDDDDDGEDDEEEEMNDSPSSEDTPRKVEAPNLR